VFVTSHLTGAAQHLHIPAAERGPPRQARPRQQPVQDARPERESRGLPAAGGRARRVHGAARRGARRLGLWPRAPARGRVAAADGGREVRAGGHGAPELSGAAGADQGDRDQGGDVSEEEDGVAAARL